MRTEEDCFPISLIHARMILVRLSFTNTSLRQKDCTDSIADIFSGFGSISNLISKMKSVNLAVTFSNRDLMAISCTLSSGDVFHNLSDN